MKEIELTKAMELGTVRGMRWITHHHVILIVLTYFATLQLHDEYSMFRTWVRHARHSTIEAAINWSDSIDRGDFIKWQGELSEDMDAKVERKPKASKH